MTKYRHARVKGYAAWRPQAATRKIITDIQTAIEQYRDHLPLTPFILPWQPCVPSGMP